MCFGTEKACWGFSTSRGSLAGDAVMVFESCRRSARRTWSRLSCSGGQELAGWESSPGGGEVARSVMGNTSVSRPGSSEGDGVIPVPVLPSLKLLSLQTTEVVCSWAEQAVPGGVRGEETGLLREVKS